MLMWPGGRQSICTVAAAQVMIGNLLSNSVTFGCGLLPNKDPFPSRNGRRAACRFLGRMFPAVVSQRQRSQWELQGRRRRWAGGFAAGCSSGR